LLFYRSRFLEAASAANAWRESCNRPPDSHDSQRLFCNDTFSRPSHYRHLSQAGVVFFCCRLRAAG